MAQHAVEAAEADDDESLAERKGDVDESKFSSLTAALLVRKRPAPASSLSAMATDLRKPQGGDALPSDFLVRKGEAEPSLPVPLGGAPSPGEQQNEELTRLRSQVSALQIKLATSEAEIARLQHGDAQAREELLLEAEEQFAKAEADWKAEAARQLAAVEARWQEDYRKGVAGARSEAGRQVAVSEAQWEEKLKRSVAELRATSEGARLQSERALNGLREECASLRAAVASRDTEIRQLRSAGEGDRAQSQRELRDALGKAEAGWKAEAARQRAEAETQWRLQSERALADAHAQWRQQSENALAEAQAQTAALRAQSERALSQLREESASLRSAIAARDSEIQQLRAAGNNERESAQAALRQAVAQAEAALKAENAKQLSATEAKWRAHAEDVVAEASEAMRAQDGELLQLRSECATLNAALTECQSLLADTQAQAQAERQRARDDFEIALADAESVSKTNMAGQLAAAEALWEENYRSEWTSEQVEAAAARECLERECRALREALSESQAKLEETCRAAQDAQDRARGELGQAIAEADAEAAQQLAVAEAAQQILAAKDAELARVQSEAGAAREEREQQMKDAMLQAERAWKAQETARLSAEAEWKRQAARELADATARFEAAERALAQLRIRNGARDASDNEEILRQRDEIATLQRRTSQSLPETREGNPTPPENTQPALRTNKDWNALSKARDADGESKTKGRAGLIGAALVIATGLTVYAGTNVLGLKLPLPDISGVFSSTISVPPTTPKPAALKKLQAVTLDRGANMRSGPNMQAPVVAFLKKGAQVTPVQTTGNWTEVRVTGGAQGWVFSEFVQPPAPAKKAPEKPPAKPLAAKAKAH